MITPPSMENYVFSIVAGSEGFDSDHNHQSVQQRTKKEGKMADS